MTRRKTAKADYITPDLRPLAAPLGSLVIDPENERKHDRGNLDAIKGSLVNFGIRDPVGVRIEGNVVIRGNGTVLALRELAAAKTPGKYPGATRGEPVAWDQVPVVMFDDDEKVAAGYRVSHNRTTELSGWVWDRLSSTLGRFGDELDWTELGWEQAELDLVTQADWSPSAVPDDGDDEGSAKGGDGESAGDLSDLVLKLEGGPADAMRVLADEQNMTPIKLLLHWIEVETGQ